MAHREWPFSMNFLFHRSRFLCSICGNFFTTRQHLQRHMSTHKREKRHKCSNCDKMFSSESRLQCHRRTHVNKSHLYFRFKVSQHYNIFCINYHRKRIIKQLTLAFNNYLFYRICTDGRKTVSMWTVSDDLRSRECVALSQAHTCKSIVYWMISFEHRFIWAIHSRQLVIYIDSG